MMSFSVIVTTAKVAAADGLMAGAPFDAMMLFAGFLMAAIRRLSDTCYFRALMRLTYNGQPGARRHHIKK